MKKFLAFLVVVAIVAAGAYFLVHKCDYCGEMFFGEAKSTETLGDLCSDCYRLYGDIDALAGWIDGQLN